MAGATYPTDDSETPEGSSIRPCSDRPLEAERHSEETFALLRWEDDGGPGQRERRPGTAVGGHSTSPGPTPRSLNRKAKVVEKPVYPTLAAHQAAEADWDYHDLAVFLDEWYARFDDRFRLRLPRVPLRLDPGIRRNCAGYFLPGHNEFGLVYEIAVAVPPPDRLAGMDRGDVLGTLLHEQLHLLQELTGVPGRNNYHNAQYRATAERFGLLVDHRGHQGYSTDSPFLELLTEYGVEPPLAVRVARAVKLGQSPPPLPPPSDTPGRSKLRKWSCGCTNVRVGVASFHARCTRPDCGRDFRPC